MHNVEGKASDVYIPGRPSRGGGKKKNGREEAVDITLTSCSSPVLATLERLLAPPAPAVLTPTIGIANASPAPRAAAPLEAAALLPLAATPPRG